MMKEIYPLSIHPRPHREEKTSEWFKRLVNTNFIEFEIFSKYVGSVAQFVGFEKAIKLITLVSNADYEQLNHDLTIDNWDKAGYCPFKDCNYRTKSKNHIETLRREFALMHDIGVKWYYCDICGYKAKLAGYVTRHKAKVHNVDRKWFHCNLCKYITDNKKSLETHKANIHHINVVWHCCDLCSYETKRKSYLKIHKAFVHNVDVKWYCCDFCDYRAKQNGHLKRHIKLIHKKKKQD